MTGRPFYVITFDCYGTLVDWRGGIARAVREASERDGIRTDDATVLALYNEIEPAVEAERYRSYRDVLTESARRVAARLGWPLADARASFLAESLPGWTPFADTNAALERLVKAGYSLGILSNTDDDLIAATRRHLTVPFDMVITAQQVRSYKPATPTSRRRASACAGGAGSTRPRVTSTTSCRRPRSASRSRGSTASARSRVPAVPSRTASSRCSPGSRTG